MSFVSEEERSRDGVVKEN